MYKFTNTGNISLKFTAIIVAIPTRPAVKIPTGLSKATNNLPIPLITGIRALKPSDNLPTTIKSGPIKADMPPNTTTNLCVSGLSSLNFCVRLPIKFAIFGIFSDRLKASDIA